MENAEKNVTKKYLLLAQKLREEVMLLADGAPLESEASLCKRYGVSRVTVRQALSVLAREGQVESWQGKGTFVRHLPVRYRDPRFHRVGMITYAYENQIFEDVIQTARHALEVEGYELLVIRTEESAACKRKALKNMLVQEIDGLLIEGIPSDLPCLNLDLYEELNRRKIPFVFTNGFHNEVNAPHVVIDDRETVSNMVDYLVALGHTRIGGIFCANQYQTKMRYRGYLDGLLRNELEYRDERVMFSTRSEQDYLFDSQLFAMRHGVMECTAMLCYNDSMARFLEATFLRMGVLIPQQMSITGLDHLWEERPYQTKLTTAAHPKGLMAEAAVEMLLTMLFTHQDVPSRVLATTFISGNTTASPRKTDLPLVQNTPYGRPSPF